jgi:hypothetical protein
MSYRKPALRLRSETFVKVTSTSQPPGVVRRRAAVTCTRFGSPGSKIRVSIFGPAG